MNLPLKILSAKQIRKADLYTIENEAIKSIDLMERAALKCFKWIQNKYDLSFSFYVFCGSGNNGGDGLIAHSYLKQYNVSSKIVFTEEKNGHTLVKEDFELICLDIVSTPSTKDAWLVPDFRTKKPNMDSSINMYVNENKKTNKIDELLDSILRD